MRNQWKVVCIPGTKYIVGAGGYLPNAMATTGTTSIKNFINKYKVK